MKKTVDVMSKTGKWLLVFGFVFSVFSSPIEVLAEELMEDENTSEDVTVVIDNSDSLNPVESNDVQPEEPVIKINGEETTEYTISENTEVTVVLEYQDETETVVLDFSKRLYGVYQYTFTSVEETVTINYVGNNTDLLKQYETVVDTTKKLSCNAEECVISGFGVGIVTVADIAMGYYNLVAFEEDYNVTAVVTDGEKILLDTDTVLNGYKLEIVDNRSEEVLENGVLVNTTPATAYTINRAGDVFVPADGLIDVKDLEVILDDILHENEITSINDVNDDGELNILDATHSIFIGSDVVEGEITDVLTNTLTGTSEEILVGDTVEVKLFISGFEQLSLYGVEGLLSYDENILELVGASLYTADETDEDLEDLGYLNLENGKFAYVLRNGFNSNEEALLVLKFEAKSTGTSAVTISDIILSYGEAFEVENDTVTLEVKVTEYGKGGDVEEEPGDLPNNTTKEEENTENTITEVEVVVKPVALSSDYYIKNLSIDGYDIEFDMYTYEYSITVGSDVTSLDLDVLLNNSNSIYYVEGNEDFEVGENLVYVVVKAENGSTKTYTIKVEKEKEVVKEDKTEIDEDEAFEEEKSTSKTIIIILIILVIIGLIYVIFKDDEEDQKQSEVKKDVKSEPAKAEKSKAQVQEKKVSSEKKKTTTKKNNKK